MNPQHKKIAEAIKSSLWGRLKGDYLLSKKEVTNKIADILEEEAINTYDEIVSAVETGKLKEPFNKTQFLKTAGVEG